MKTPQRTARPQEPAVPPRLVGKTGRAARGAGYFLRRVAGPILSLQGRRIAGYTMLLLGLLGQVVLLWLAGELVDLYVSAVELWAVLARKHLELTM
jgi:hypothetical protein